MMKPVIKIKRVYEAPSEKDGYRILVDRLWPRGLKKEDASIDEWLKDIAPSDELRKWFGHDPQRWQEFQKKYTAALKKNTVAESFMEKYKHTATITLVYGAKDELHNQAVVLQKFLENLFREQ